LERFSSNSDSHLLIIGDHLIDRKGAYIPDVLRTVILFVGLTVAVLVILRLVMNINVVALVALPTVATAVVGVAAIPSSGFLLVSLWAR